MPLRQCLVPAHDAGAQTALTAVSLPSVSHTALHWSPQALQQALRPWLPDVQVQALASVDSTNTRALQHLRGGKAAAPLLVVAEAQTQGRGRNGRVWHSSPGASLTFSIGLRLAAADWAGLSLAVGVAVAEAIEPLSEAKAPRLQLKWPNDLWLADRQANGDAAWRKLGGILIESVAVQGERMCVVGIGLNVLSSAAGPDSGHAQVQELHADVSAPVLLARVAPAVAAALRRFECEGLAPFAAAFARRDLLRGRAVSTTMAGLPEGVAEGVDAQGALRLRHAGGLALVNSGEVSVRPLPVVATVGA